MFFLCSGKPEGTKVAQSIAENQASDGSRLPADVVTAVRDILSVPDERLDYGRAKLALDRLVDPMLDREATMRELDRLAEAARGLAGPEASGGAKLAALRKLIYESGPWNGHRPFAYDHSDPLGQHIPNKLLHNYLATRRGQCVSMPVLFLILADRLGLNMALASAPGHVFLRYTDPSERVINLEATRGAYPARTEWFRHNFPMNDRALQSGIYMRSLSRREGVALMATTVLECLMHKRRYQEATEVAGIILERDPRAGQVMVMQGSAYGALLQAEFVEKYPILFLIPEHLRSRHLLLCERNNSLIAAAEALGWEPGE